MELFTWVTLTVSTRIGATPARTKRARCCQIRRHATTCMAVVYDSKQKGTFVSARWQREYSPDLCWVSSVCGHPQPATSSVLGNFPHSQHRPSTHQSYTMVCDTTPTRNGGISGKLIGKILHGKSRIASHSFPVSRFQLKKSTHVSWVHCHQLPTLQSPEAFVVFIFHVWTKKQRTSATIRRIRRPGHRRQSH